MRYWTKFVYRGASVATIALAGYAESGGDLTPPTVDNVLVQLHAADRVRSS